MQKHSLEALARELMEKAAGGAAGRTAQTVMGGHEKVLRQTVIAMVAGAELTEHANPGEATVYVLRGRVALTSGGQTWEGRDGDLLIVPGAPHALKALQDSAVLLTVAKLQAPATRALRAMPVHSFGHAPASSLAFDNMF